MKELLKRLAGRPAPSPTPAPGESGGDGLNHVDLCFVVDTTGSMSPFIDAARGALLDTVGALGAKGGVDLRVGLVEYRDHPPQESTFVTRHHALTADLGRMQKVIGGLRADGGGDAPEAVYDGVSEAALLADWRAHSCRFILLVGDAPPHGYVARAASPEAAQEGPARRRGGARASGGARARGPETCLCGLDASRTTAAAEEARVTVHALPMQDDVATFGAFAELARATGGACAPPAGAEQVVARIGEMLDAEFGELGLDREVLEAARRLGSQEAGEIAGLLGRTRLQAARSLARLGRRGFLRSFEGAVLTTA
jgi:hypothetical protein